MAEEPTVKISFSFNNSETKHEINISNPAIININEIAPDAVSSNTSYGYAGRHDHGPMIILKSDPAGCNLISSLQEAKQACDEHLTQSMKKEADDLFLNASHQAEKKPRLYDTA